MVPGIAEGRGDVGGVWGGGINIVGGSSSSLLRQETNGKDGKGNDSRGYTSALFNECNVGTINIIVQIRPPVQCNPVI